MDEYKIGDYIEVIKDNDEIMICIIDNIYSEEIHAMILGRYRDDSYGWILPINKGSLFDRRFFSYQTKSYRKLSNEEILQWKMEL